VVIRLALTVVELLTSGTFWVGLIGVLSLIFGFLTPLLHEQRQSANEWRRSRRLILGELDRLAAVATFLAVEVPRHGRFPRPTVGLGLLATPMWDEHRARIAEPDRLPVEIWKHLTFAYGMVEAGRGAMAFEEEVLETWQTSTRNLAKMLLNVRDELAAVNVRPWWHVRFGRNAADSADRVEGFERASSETD